jgi:pilus assembly protein CpaF
MSSLQQQVLAALRHELQVIQPYLDDPLVQEVMINNPDTVFIERAGRTERVDVTFDKNSLHSLIVTLSNHNDKATTHLLDARLPGLRLAATLPPIAVHGPALAIRRHSSVQFTFEDYIASGAFTPSRNTWSGTQALDDSHVHEGGDALSDFFMQLMRAKINFVITGSTSSGKTAFLNMLAQYIPEWERVVTIEDTQELQIKVQNWLAFEANPTLGVDIRALVKHALRNRPNRILVGEARGQEMFDILDAYNTGHPGSAVTFHSNSAAQALPRLENMVRMAPEASNWPLQDLRSQIASTFSYVIHCSNAGGIRGPVEVHAIRGCDKGQYQLETLFQRT